MSSENSYTQSQARKKGFQRRGHLGQPQMQLLERFDVLVGALIFRGAAAIGSDSVEPSQPSGRCA